MSEILNEVRAELARISREDADRRVTCPVCGWHTANQDAHDALHQKEQR